MVRQLLPNTNEMLQYILALQNLDLSTAIVENLKSETFDFFKGKSADLFFRFPEQPLQTFDKRRRPLSHVDACLRLDEKLEAR
jgi:hypothetical protein